MDEYNNFILIGEQLLPVRQTVSFPPCTDCITVYGQACRFLSELVWEDGGYMSAPEQIESFDDGLTAVFDMEVYNRYNHLYGRATIYASKQSLVGNYEKNTMDESIK